MVLGCATNEVGHLTAALGDLSEGKAPRGRFDAEIGAACGTGALTSIGDRVIQRRPYLQKVTDDSASILWTATSAAAVELYRPESKEIVEVDAVVDTTAPLPVGNQYMVSFDALEPATIYCYEIAGDRGDLIETSGFRTAPATGSDEPVPSSITVVAAPAHSTV